MPMKPSAKEQQFFIELELKRRLEEARKAQELMAAAERKRLKERHFMQCPKCGHHRVVDRYGKVEIDVCGVCKGLWLDAQELETILESAKKRGPFQSLLKILGGSQAAKRLS